MTSTPIRHELLYGTRVVRCFAGRPPSIDAMFRASVARHPEREAVVLGDTRLTYRDLDDAVERIARNLIARGLRAGDRVGLLLDNGVPFVQAFLAAARAGLIAVPMNTRQRRPEIAFVLAQCRAAALIFDAAHAANLPLVEETPHLTHRFVVGGDGGTPFDALLVAADAVDFEPVDEQDPLCSTPRGRPASPRARC